MNKDVWILEEYDHELDELVIVGVVSKEEVAHTWETDPHTTKSRSSSCWTVTDHVP